MIADDLLILNPCPNLAQQTKSNKEMITACFRSNKQLLCAYATELVAPLLRVSAPLYCGNPTPRSAWRKGLLIGASHIGDILYRTSSFSQLAKRFPECSWDILAPDPAAQVLEGNTSIRKIHRMEIPTFGSENFRALQQESYDVAICYDTGMYTRPLLTATLLGIPNRVGYVHKGWSGLMTCPISIRYPQPYPAYFRDLVSQVTGQAPDWDLRPKIHLTDDDYKEAQLLWSELELSAERPVLACFITTRQPTGVWPLERFQETLEMTHNSCNVQFLLCGATQDKEKLQNLQASLSFRTSINAGRLGLRPLVALLSRCSVVLSTDSGPRHLANAAGVSVIYLRNLRSSRVETGNYLDTEYDMSPEVEFVAPTNQGDYLKLVDAKKVANNIVCLLSRK
jgi:ADP-heptose:LPS heptosyltransferase